MYDSRVENVREKAINWFCSSRPEFSFHTVGMVNLDLWRWMVISSKYEMCWIVIGSKMRRQESAFNLSTDLLKVQSSKFFELPLEYGAFGSARTASAAHGLSPINY